MKKLLAAAMALMLMVSGAAGLASGVKMSVVNCNEWVSLRSGPSSSNKQIAKVPLGTVVTDCYQAENGYVWCNYNGQGGYISSSYLKAYAQQTSTDAGTSSNTTTSSTVTGQKLGEMKVTNCSEWVTMRSGPGSNYSQVLRVPLNAIVTGCMQAENGYIWCCYDEQVGYVAEQYLKVYKEWMEPNMGFDPSDEIGDMKVVNCTDWVSLRSGPSTSYKRIAQVPAGTVVNGCYPDENGFIWCNFGGLYGYISSDYLAVYGQNYTPGYDESAKLGSMVVVNCDDWVSLRSEPSSSSTQIAKVPLGGLVIKCYQAENGYIWGSFNGQTGYISADYLASVVG